MFTSQQSYRGKGQYAQTPSPCLQSTCRWVLCTGLWTLTLECSHTARTLLGKRFFPPHSRKTLHRFSPYFLQSFPKLCCDFLGKSAAQPRWYPCGWEAWIFLVLPTYMAFSLLLSYTLTIFPTTRELFIFF